MSGADAVFRRCAHSTHCGTEGDPWDDAAGACSPGTAAPATASRAAEQGTILAATIASDQSTTPARGRCSVAPTTTARDHRRAVQPPLSSRALTTSEISSSSVNGTAGSAAIFSAPAGNDFDLISPLTDQSQVTEPSSVETTVIKCPPLLRLTTSPILNTVSSSVTVMAWCGISACGLDPGGDVHRLDGADRRHAAARAPGLKELIRGAGISPARVRVANVGRHAVASCRLRRRVPTWVR